MEKTGLSGYVYVDYWAIANDKILDIHKYLTKNNNIDVFNIDLLKNVFLQQLHFLVTIHKI